MSPSVFDHCFDKHTALSRGFSLLEAVVVLTVSLSVISLGAKYFYYSLLFRKNIAGHPEYNRMEADLKMAANIELEDGTKIWFNQGSDRSTVIEGGYIALTHGQDSLTLRPERLVVNTAQGITGYRGIETNSHVVAAGDVDAGRDLTAKNSITAGKDITAAGDLYVNKLKIGNMELTSDSLKFNGVDIRRDADIPEYWVNKMYERGQVWQVAHDHCSNHWSRLFIVKDNGEARHLLMCLPSTSPNGSDYWIVATGYYGDRQTMDKRRP